MTLSAPSAASNTATPPRPRHPAIDLLARYRAVFGAAWAQRHALAGPLRLADEAAFLPAALSLQDTPVHPAPRRLAWLLIVLFITALAWSILGRIDIVAVASGRVVVSQRSKLIQPLERSVVQRVLVADGDRVQAGQPLVELDPTAATADRASATDALKAAQSEVLRSRALQQALGDGQGRAPGAAVTAAASGDFPERLVQAWPDDWPAADVAAARAQLQGEWADIAAKLAKSVAEIDHRQAEIATAREVVSKLEATVPLAQAREADFKQLVAEGYITGHATQDKTRERIELERDLATQRARLAEAGAALRESQNARAAYLAEVRRTLYDREAQADLKRQQATQERAKATQRESLTTLRAPVAGTVQQLAVHTVGGVATEAQTLMVVVPDGADVTAEVTLDNKDIGFVHTGQPAVIKLETFPYTRYGTLPAEVQRVSADAVTDEKLGAIFPVTLKLNTRQIDIDGKLIALAPGMNLTAEIKTGQRRVIEYLLSPIQRAGSESLRER